MFKKSKKSMFGPIALTCLMSFGLHADVGDSATPSDCCPQLCPCCSQPPMRITVRHIDPNGIGYHPGYTTIEGFFTTFEPWCDAWVPFLDVRGHVFNNGKWAANAGIGLRYLTACRVWGANVYYDYRRTKHHHNFNQIGAGLESLGQTWDFRINGYFPVGKREKFFSNFQFDGFKGNSLILSRKREVAMTGFNAEVGYHYDCWECFPIYAAIGPYYLNGKGHSAWGGKLRARVDFWDYVHVEGNVSYDRIFKWIGQGEIGISYSFGCRRTIKTRCGNCCDTALTLSDRSLQPVDRFEIIAIDEHRKKEKAIDPITGQPWFFIFVNNLSHSLGTFESPFPTLLEAQNASHPNDAIYVFPGDGTTNGYASGITLQYGQWFLGAGNQQIIPTTVGNIVIPPLASIQPKITNTPGNIVTVSNDNVVSGFDFLLNTVNQSGIVGIGINNLTAIQNTFITPAAITDTNGIFLTNPTGIINVGSSIFSNMVDMTSVNFGNGVYIELDGATLNTLNVFENTFTNMSNPAGQNGGNAVLVNFLTGINTLNNFNCTANTLNNMFDLGEGFTINLFSPSSVLNSFTVTNNIFNNIAGTTPFVNGGASIFLVSPNSTITNWTISDNIFNNLNNSGTGIVWFSSGNCAGSTLNNFNISSNTFNNTVNNAKGIGFFQFGVGNSVNNFTVSSNTFNSLISGATGGSSGIFLNTENTLNGTLNNFIVSENNFSNIDNSFGVFFLLDGTGYTFVNTSFSKNTFTNLSDNSPGILFFQDFAGNKMDNVSISECTFDNISTGSYGVRTHMGLTNLSITDCTFTNISGINSSNPGAGSSTGIKMVTGNGQQIINTNIGGNTFSNISNTGSGVEFILSGGAAPVNVNTSNNIFNNISDTGLGITASLSLTDPIALNISSNTYNGPTATTTGYAATVSLSTGTLCLEFIGNITAPATVTDPYEFKNIGGTFNRTTGSDQTTNTGTIHTDGVINPPGSCTQ